MLAYAEGDGEARSRPERVAHPHPGQVVPVAEHAGLLDAEVHRLGHIRRQSHKVLVKHRFLPQIRKYCEADDLILI